MKKSLFKCLMAFVAMLCASVAYSQSVSGKVTDGSGPLPGVSILVKGTTNGTQTNFDGTYTISNIGSDAILIYSYIGFKSQEISASGKSNINVTLKEESNKLSEVVVIGYGTVKKKDATGAVDQITSKNFDNVAATSPAELLRGKVAGVQITQSSGEPGSATSIRIRGNSSIRSGNNPLIVVDGVPLDGGNVSSGGSDIVDVGSSSARNPLNFINQNDIESMSILKDASSTAIYGSRGANGVIVITTKKGKSKAPQLSYSTSMQFSKRSGDFKLLDSNQFAAASPGQDKGSRYYDWEKDILQSGFSTNHDLSFSKSTDDSNTRISFGATLTDGIVKNTGLDKYTASFYNSNDYFGGSLKVESRIIYAALKDKTTLITNNAGYIGNLIGSALYWNPTLPIYNSNGSYNVISDDYLNPVQLLNSYDDFTNTNKLIGSINTTYKINKHLKYQFLFGIETSNSSKKRQVLPTIQIRSRSLSAVDDVNGGVKNGYGNIAEVDKFNKTFEHNLNYNNDFSDNFGLDAIIGYSYYDYNYNEHTSSGVGYNIAQTNIIDNIEGGIASKFTAYSNRNRVELQSFFGRVNLTLFKKLILTGTVRQDGSTKLGKDNKYDYFPSFGLAYKVIEDKEGIFNTFKIRGNYGKTGNQEFAPNAALGKSTYSPGGGISGTESTNQNSTLRWETTTSYGVGADFELLNKRVTGSVDYFLRDTESLIFGSKPASSQPGPNVNRSNNLEGNLINKGIEVSLNLKIVNTENFTWDFSANAAFLSNKMTNFGVKKVNTGGINGQGLTGVYVETIRDELPIYSYFMYDFQGYNSDGNSIYTNAAGENVGLAFAERKLLDKQPLPKINTGFSTTLTYKGFDATASFYGAFGHYIYNNTTNAYFVKSALVAGRNVTPDVASSKQSDSDPNSPSTKFLEKGDFLRMGNLTFGYTVRGNVLDKLKMKTARFFVNADNLFVITKYSGFDPEVDTDKSLGGVPSAGIDYLSYPRAKSLGVGLSVTF
jgi:TonB-dependent starch-binding outer membrane protein SusC